MGNWMYHIVCDECDWHKCAPFASLFHANVKCCPECGKESFSLKKMRFNSSKTKWFNPFTWDNGYWEVFDESY